MVEITSIYIKIEREREKERAPKENKTLRCNSSFSNIDPRHIHTTRRNQKEKKLQFKKSYKTRHELNEEGKFLIFFCLKLTQTQIEPAGNVASRCTFCHN